MVGSANIRVNRAITWCPCCQTVRAGILKKSKDFLDFQCNECNVTLFWESTKEVKDF